MRYILYILAVSARIFAMPNIVLIVADDQRPDTIHALGNDVIDTPNLDRLVAHGTAFSRAYATYPICHVSRAQIITGCPAFKALPQYPAGAIDPNLATLAGTFSGAGYYTCYSGKWHNDGHPKQRGYSATSGLFSSGGNQRVVQPTIDDRGRPLTGYRGWTFKDADNKVELAKGVGLLPDNSRHIADGAIQALHAAPKDKPFLLHINFAFPHDPRQWPEGMKDRYASAQMRLPANFAPKHPFDHGNIDGRDELLLPTPRPEVAVREEIALYYAMITDMDANVGRIIDALTAVGHEEDTIIVFTSDQGLALGSHGLLGKQNQYEHSIRSPLVVVGPGLPRGERTGALAQLSDLFPTLCDLAGIAIPATVSSPSLAPLLRHHTNHVHDFIIGAYTDAQRMICDLRWKFIDYPKAKRTQLFDLANDPDELNDLSESPTQATTLEGMKSKLSAWLKANTAKDNH